MDVKTLFDELTKQDNDGWTPLDIAAHHQSPKAVIESIKMVDAEDLNATLAKQNKHGRTLLHRYLPKEVFIALIENASPKALSDASTLQDKDGLTPFYIAARRQSEKTVIELIKKADETAVSDALAIRNNHDWTVMTMAVDCGKTSVVLALFEKFQDEERLKEILFFHATSWEEKKNIFSKL